LKTAKFLMLIAVVVIGFVSQTSYASSEGGVAGGGGNSILCNDGKYYSYDFILTQKTTGRVNQAFRNMEDPVQMIRLIANIMAVKVPAMSASLNDFILGLQSKEFDTGISRIWIPGLNPLAPVGDESRLRIPAMCLNSKGEPKIYQTVIRFKNSSNVIQYNYDERQILELHRSGALQVSFLYIHEWLRDYTEDASVILNIVRMLHEEGWITASPEGVLSAMRRYGLNTQALAPYVPAPAEIAPTPTKDFPQQ